MVARTDVDFFWTNSACWREQMYVACVQTLRLFVLARKDENVYRFKGFDSARCGDSMNSLEQLVNVWMEEEHPRIRHMCQSVRGEHILLSFVYEETRELEQRVAAQTQTALPRYFEDEFIDDRPTGGRIPATPPPMH